MDATFDYDLFILHAAAERGWVQSYLLPALNLSPERVMMRDATQLGAVRADEFERAVTHSRYTLLIISPAFLADAWSRFGEALASHISTKTDQVRVIPLLKVDCDVPPRLDMRVGLDCRLPDQWEEAVIRLQREFNRSPLSNADAILPPYPGLCPYTEKDSARFFGRRRETEELIVKLAHHHFLAVIGPSGSGKSSLVLAGLVPVLRRSTQFGIGGWQVLTLRPGERPLAALTAALGSDPSDAAQAVTSVLADRLEHRLLLIIDQFEEVFTTAREDTTAFQESLRRIAARPDGYVVLTARSDFYSELFETPLWEEIQAHRFEITPLKADGLREAIRRPAEAVGVFVEDALAERLVADANVSREPGILPLVQETLRQLWDRREQRLLPLHAYEALGDDERTGLAVALARHADQVMADLKSAAARIEARRILLNLIQPGDQRLDTRRQLPVDALREGTADPIVFEEVLRALTQGRLLTLGGEENRADQVVDLSHEKLIDGWPALRAWINQSREAMRIGRRLEDKAAEWLRLGKSGGLLDQVELQEAEVWLRSPDAAVLGCSAALKELITTSRAALKDERRTWRQQRLVRAALVALLSLIGLIVMALAGMALAGVGPFERPGEWVRGEGLKGSVLSLVVDPHDSQTLIAGTATQGIFRSSNGGRAWSNVLPLDKEVPSLTAASDGVIYAGVQGGQLLRSVNGTVWDSVGQVPVAQEVDQLLIDPLQPDILYAMEIGQPYLYRSENGGIQWDKFTLSAERPNLMSLAVTPSQAATVLYAVTLDDRVFRSTNRGKTWADQVAITPLASATQVVVDPAVATRLYISTQAGIAQVEWDGQRLTAHVLLPDAMALFLVTDRLAPQVMYFSGVTDIHVLYDQTTSQVTVPITTTLPGHELVQYLQGGDHQPFYLYAASSNGVFGWKPAPQEKVWLPANR